VDVTIADRTNHHLFQPLLYQVASGLLSEGLIAPPLRRVIKHQRNARAVQSDVTHFDLDKHFVYGVTPDGRRLHRRYDTLVVAGGATHAYFGNDHWAGFAPGMKTLVDARKLRSHILSAFESAETIPDPSRRAALLTFVVVGAAMHAMQVLRLRGDAAGPTASASSASSASPVGVHFFSPVPVMKLVEIVVALDTAPETADIAFAFAKKLGKHPIRAKDRAGFIVNLLLTGYIMAAIRMYEEGFASREDIDEGMRLGAGHPMGPLTLADMPPDQLSFAAPSICLEGLAVPCDTTTVVLGESRRARGS
jgi:hypothetical protein